MQLMTAEKQPDFASRPMHHALGTVKKIQQDQQNRAIAREAKKTGDKPKAPKTKLPKSAASSPLPQATPEVARAISRQLFFYFLGCSKPPLR